MKKELLVLFVILIAAKLLFSQSPGGVSSNLTAWFDAKNGTSTTVDGTAINSWLNNYNNLGVPSIIQTDIAKQPIFRSNEINYNPIVEFDGNNDFLYQANTLGSDLFGQTENTIFMMHRNYSGIVYFKWEHTTNNTDRIGFERSGTNVRLDFPTSDGGNQTVSTANYKPTGEIVTAHMSSNASTLRFDGAQNVVNNTTGSMNVNLTREFIIGNNPTTNPLACNIDYAELIIYNSSLSLIEMNKVESYMAIKYGVTLGQNGTSLDYNSSTGNVIWDVSANAGYNFDISGIANDIGTALDQRKSKTINEISPGVTRDILIAANGTNYSIPDPINTDQSFFVWGHNDNATNFTSVPVFSTMNGGNISEILDRKWKSQELGPVGVVTLHFDMTNVSNNNNWSGLRLIVDNDGNFGADSYTYNPSFVDSLGVLSIEFEHDFSATEGFYFTIGTIIGLDITNPLPVATCDSYTLPAITGSNLVNPQYYSEPGGAAGTGLVIPVGTVINSDVTIYLYDETGGIPNIFDEDTLDISIYLTPVIDLFSDVEICDSFTLPAITGTNLSGDESYWTATNGTGTEYNSGDNLTANISLFIYDETSSTPNCSDEQSFQIIIHSTPIVDSPTDVVECDSHSLPVLSSGNYFTGAAGSGTQYLAGDVISSSQMLYVYAETGTLVNCTDEDSFLITIIPTPLASAGPDKVLTCDSTTVYLDGTLSTPAMNYIWQDASGTPIPGAVFMEYTANTPGFYTLIVTNSINNCSSTDQVEVTQDIAMPTANAGPDLILNCDYPTHILNGSLSSSGMHYSWTSTGGNIVSGTTTTNPLVDQTGYYTITVRNNTNGCSSSDVVFVSENFTVPVADAVMDQTICSNEMIHIGGTSNVNNIYVWSPALNLNNSNISNPIFQVANTTGQPVIYDFTVNVENSNSACESSDQVSITVNPEVISGINIQASVTTICEGELVEFTSSVTNEGVDPVYNWQINGSNTGVNSSIFSSTSLSNQDVITCVLSSSEDCLQDDNVISNTILIHVVSALIVEVEVSQSPEGLLCQGENVSFMALPINQGSSPIFEWTLNGDSVGNNTDVFSPDSIANGDVVNCRLTSSIECVLNAHATGSFVVSVAPFVELMLTADDYKICAGDEVEIEAIASSGNGGPYLIINSDGNIISPSYTVSPSHTTMYSATATDGCTSAFAELEIEVVDKAEISFKTGAKTGCEPLKVKFISSSDQDGLDYLWTFRSDNSISSVKTKDPSFTFVNDGLYDVILKVSNEEGCESVLTTLDHIRVNPKPEVSFSTNTSTVTNLKPSVSFTNYTQGALYYVWDFGDSTNTSTEHPEHKYTHEGVYDVVLTAFTHFGCEANATTSITYRNESTFFAPTAFTPDGDRRNDNFVVKGTNIYKATFQMFIYNRWGELIFKTSDFEKGWDGRETPYSEIAPVGIYTWKVRYQNLDGTPRDYSGTVNLIR